MIFGFNTDIKHEGTVYHVQSEARQQETLLQTQVFLRGRCIGKRASTYGERASQPGFAEAQIEQLLREQHKLVSDAIKEGRLENVLDKHETPESLAAVRQLDLQWVNASDIFPDSTLLLRLLVTDAGAPAVGAKLVSRVDDPGQKPTFTDAVTDAQGAAEMKFALDESALSQASILVQASHAGRTTTRKFSFRKSAR
jgi:hypothetical protein